MFDIQVKRIHEYKRQHLNVLHIITQYYRLKQNPGLEIPPRAFIFGGKAAPGYFMAKRIIKLINAVGETVNNDPDVNRFLQVAFVPNFNVQNAHLIYPAANLSEQISTAGKEASGTGNMKFMINGALTIGTLDGANVEIREEAGAENFFLFGLTVDEVERVKRDGYRPADYVDGNDELAAVLDLIAGGRFSHGDTEVFRPLVDNLRYDDPFLVLADYASYIECQERVSAAWRDTRRVDADVDPEHRAQRQVLVGPRDRRVLRRHLERVAGDGQALATAAHSGAQLGVSSEKCTAGIAVDGHEIGSVRPGCSRRDPGRSTFGIRDGHVGVERNIRRTAGTRRGDGVPRMHSDRIGQPGALCAVGLALDGAVGARAVRAVGTP